MTAITWILLAVTLAVAVVDWVAVVAGRKALEYAAKPATMVALLAAAATIDVDHTAVRTWFLVAIVFSLLGDVFLMLPRDLFVFGLGAFLLGHLAYIAGMVTEGVTGPALAVGVAVVAVAMATLGRRILTGVRAAQPELAVPVVAYMVVISAMVACAFGLLEPVAVVGALLFYASDATIAWTRFIADFPRGRLLIIVTYHLSQVGLVLSLVT